MVVERSQLTVLVRVPEGFGYLTASDYHALTAEERERLTMLALCPSESVARWLFSHLPQSWEGETWEESSRRPVAVDVAIVERELASEDAEEQLCNQARLVEVWGRLTPPQRQVLAAYVRFLHARGGGDAALA